MVKRVKRDLVYEGKAKILYKGTEPGTYIQYFKDDISAFNGQKKALIKGKGIMNNRISGHLMTQLKTIGISTHFIRSLNMREQLVERVEEIIPVEVVVRNIAAGGLVKRLDLKEGFVLPRSILEYYYKSDTLNDPMINEEHILAFDWAEEEELEEMVTYAERVNDYLRGLFYGVGLNLVDFKLEFGRICREADVHTILVDEISPDTCRLWDICTGEKYDKDRFRYDLGDVGGGYVEVCRRLGILPENEL